MQTNNQKFKMKLFIFLLFFIVPYIFAADDKSLRINRQADESVPLDTKVNNQGIDKTKSEVPKNIDVKPPAQNPANNVSVSTHKQDTKKISNITSANNSKIIISASTSQIPTDTHVSSINSGALMRGVFVMLGLSVIVMAYMVFRGLRLKKSRPQMVRKYGILAHRQDVEMRPLPLEEDDEDDTTVFDASHILKNGP